MGNTGEEVGFGPVMLEWHIRHLRSDVRRLLDI